MTTQLTLTVPSTLTVLASNATLSSLQGPGPGISLSGAGVTDIVSVQITAANAGALFGIGNADGATVSSSANTLSLAGTQTQINVALASLQITEPFGTANDSLSLSATDTAATGVARALLVDVASTTGPAFVAPPVSINVTPNSLTTLSGLVLSDPIAVGLAAMGLGKEETLSVWMRACCSCPALRRSAGLRRVGWVPARSS